MAKAPRYGEIDPGEPLGALANAVLRSLWTAMLSESDAVFAPEGVEAVHDMRVAMRRLRFALRTFRDSYPRRRLKRIVKRTRRLRKKLGEVRDADVHLEALRSALAVAAETQRAGIAFAIEQVTGERAGALSEFAVLLSQFDRDALERILTHA